MLGLDLARRRDEPLVVLAIGAHSDDIEIGCGGTVLTLAQRYPALEVVWVVLGAEGDRAAEARASAERFLAGVGRTTIRLEGFEDGFLPYEGGAAKRFFETLKRDLAPDVVLTHARHDLHQDHRLACELTWNTFRDHLILEYEVPKFDGDLATPNVYVPLAEELCERKLDTLLECFASQRDKHWFTREVLRGLLSIRGAECRSPSGYAEAFFGRKLVL